VEAGEKPEHRQFYEFAEPEKIKDKMQALLFGNPAMKPQVEITSSFHKV